MQLPRINIASADVQSILRNIDPGCLHLIGTVEEFGVLLHTLAASVGPLASGDHRVLDIIAHSTQRHHYLRIGRTAVDLLDRGIVRMFESLRGPVSYLAVRAIRLLGCETAVELPGQLTMVRLAKLLGVQVFGTRRPLLAAHYDALGFRSIFEHLLVEAGSLPRPLDRLSAAAPNRALPLNRAAYSNSIMSSTRSV
jgi:hypothetical protein